MWEQYSFIWGWNQHHYWPIQPLCCGREKNPKELITGSTPNWEKELKNQTTTITSMEYDSQDGAYGISSILKNSQRRPQLLLHRHPEAQPSLDGGWRGIPQPWWHGPPQCPSYGMAYNTLQFDSLVGTLVREFASLLEVLASDQLLLAWQLEVLSFCWGFRFLGLPNLETLDGFATFALKLHSDFLGAGW